MACAPHQVIHYDGKLKEKTGKSAAVSVQTQTLSKKEMKGGWNPWVWLVMLQVWSSRNADDDKATVEIQTDLTLDSKIKPLVRSVGMVTMQEMVQHESDFDRWWSAVQLAAEEDLKTIKYKPKMQMTKAQILNVISTLYADKVVQDELDDRTGRPRMQLSAFLHMYMLGLHGSPVDADKAVIMVVANILAHLRQLLLVIPEEEGAGDKLNARHSLFFVGISPRVRLFARFLGLKHDDLEPVPQEGLGVYLMALVRTQKGSVPLLPLSGDRVMVNTDDYLKTLDYVFANSRSVTREVIKGDLLSRNPDYNLVDLDFALDFTLEAWKEVMGKLDARLMALFSTVMANERFDFETFNQVPPHALTSPQHITPKTSSLVNRVTLTPPSLTPSRSLTARDDPFQGRGLVNALTLFGQRIDPRFDPRGLVKRLDPRMACGLGAS